MLGEPETECIHGRIKTENWIKLEKIYLYKINEMMYYRSIGIGRYARQTSRVFVPDAPYAHNGPFKEKVSMLGTRYRLFLTAGGCLVIAHQTPTH